MIADVWTWFVYPNSSTLKWVPMLMKQWNFGCYISRQSAIWLLITWWVILMTWCWSWCKRTPHKNGKCLDHIFSHFFWECHHPNWRSPSFFRGVGQPPTRYWRDISSYNFWVGRLASETYCILGTGWWFGTFVLFSHIFPNSWDDDPIWLIFFRGIETTRGSSHRKLS